MNVLGPASTNTIHDFDMPGDGPSNDTDYSTDEETERAEQSLGISATEMKR